MVDGLNELLDQFDRELDELAKGVDATAGYPFPSSLREAVDEEASTPQKPASVANAEARLSEPPHGQQAPTLDASGPDTAPPRQPTEPSPPSGHAGMRDPGPHLPPSEALAMNSAGLAEAKPAASAVALENTHGDRMGEYARATVAPSSRPPARPVSDADADVNLPPAVSADSVGHLLEEVEGHAPPTDPPDGVAELQEFAQASATMPPSKSEVDVATKEDRWESVARKGRTAKISDSWLDAPVTGTNPGLDLFAALDAPDSTEGELDEGEGAYFRIEKVRVSKPSSASSSLDQTSSSNPLLKVGDEALSPRGGRPSDESSEFELDLDDLIELE